MQNYLFTNEKYFDIIINVKRKEKHKKLFKKNKKPIDKQNKICYNIFIKGKEKQKRKNKKMLDKPLKRCYNKYVKNK